MVGIGYTLNPHYLCAANADVDSSKCAIVQHADDNNVFHERMKVVKSAVSKLEDRFGIMSQKFVGPDHIF